MITFEIKASPDEERIGSLTYFFENLTLGNSIRSTFFIEDSELEHKHLKMRHQSNGLLITSFDDHFYFSNGKKIKGSKLHKVGDVIKVGQTEIEIKELVFKNLSKKFEEIYEERLSQNPELKTIVTQLQKELLFIEQNKDV